MPSSKINTTMQKSIEGIFNLDDEPKIEVEGHGEILIKEAFQKFDGEYVKLVLTVSNNEGA